MHTRPVPASVPSAPALELRGITKRYPGTLALDGVDLVLQGGEVHALLGENGAGKSTLLQVIAGGFDDYEGEVRVAGRSVRLHSPAAARACGIALVHQELNLAPPQSVAENVLAGRLPRRAGVLVDRRALREGAARALARVGLDVDPGLPVEALSQAEAQLVEIAKALSADPRILVLDEPTSALGREEAERLLAIVRRLRDEGLAIVFVSHHLAEVFAVADRVTVLRDGRRVASGPAAETSPAAVAAHMVGTGSADAAHARARGRATAAERPVGAATPRLAVRGITRRGFLADCRVRPTRR
jgi:ribose transport system ATP-binding protein